MLLSPLSLKSLTFPLDSSQLLLCVEMLTQPGLAPGGWLQPGKSWHVTDLQPTLTLRSGGAGEMLSMDSQTGRGEKGLWDKHPGLSGQCSALEKGLGIEN